MKVLRGCLLLAAVFCVRVSGEEEECLLPVPDPQRLFSPTPGAEGQELARVAAQDYKACVSQCCEQSEGVCSVVAFCTPEDNTQPNCILYHCQQVINCSVPIEDEVQIYAASEAVRAIFSSTDLPPKELTVTAVPASTVNALTSAKWEDFTTANSVVSKSPSEGVKTDAEKSGLTNNNETSVVSSTVDVISGSVSTNSAENNSIIAGSTPVPALSAGTGAAPAFTSGITPAENVSTTQLPTNDSVPLETHPTTISVQDQVTSPSNGTTSASMSNTTVSQDLTPSQIISTGQASSSTKVPSTQSFTTQAQTPTNVIQNSTVKTDNLASPPAVVPNTNETEESEGLTTADAEVNVPGTTIASTGSVFQLSPSTPKVVEEQENETSVPQDVTQNGTIPKSSATNNNTLSTRQQSSSLTSLSLGTRTLLICTLSIGCIFFLAVLVIVGKRVVDGWKKRHYSRIDYLVDGMYSE